MRNMAGSTNLRSAPLAPNAQGCPNRLLVAARYTRHWVSTDSSGKCTEESEEVRLYTLGVLCAAPCFLGRHQVFHEDGSWAEIEYKAHPSAQPKTCAGCGLRPLHNAVLNKLDSLHELVA
ncbi:hypothetical protein BTHE68_41240 [Burkholderia sp. THE68]|nr:hypothetical protein BTHE68_41240 [Burkholderia sp. THE68]